MTHTITLPAKRQQRWYDLMYRWGRRRWPRNRIDHLVAFNAMLQVPEFMKQKFLRRELQRKKISTVNKVTSIDNALTGETTWIIQ